MATIGTNESDKIAALLSLDIQTTALAASQRPNLAAGLMARLEQNRIRIIDDVEYRNTRFEASMMVFGVATANSEKQGD